jgi:LacI family transcriptional regulator
MHKRIASVRSESVSAQHRGGLHHARHRVILLLGFYNIPLHTGIVRYAREADWVLEDNYVRVGLTPVGWQGDGILALITNPKDAEALSQLPRLPLVDFSKGWIADSMPAKYRAAGLGRPRVIYDNVSIGRLAAEHFLERGFKHIAYMNYGNFWMETERIPSFSRTIEAAGGTYHEIAYHEWMPKSSPATLRDHRRAHQRLVKTILDLPKPVGIAASVDNIATLLLQACDIANVSVPEEVAVLGCDNDPMVCDYALVPLSSVDNDWERVGYEGARLLDHLMAGRRAPREPILIPPKGVVTRLSTNILAVPDKRLARAVRFIWDHYPEPIGTREVAAAAGVNRRKLERDFLKHLGQSVNREIAQTRIEHAKKMLRETRLKAHEVARQCGFSSVSYFSKCFQRFTGLRPSRYRRQAAATNA